MNRRRRDDRIERIRGVEREARTAVVAVAALDDVLRANPSALAVHELRPLNLRNFRDNLEPTYLIRIFAEFESGLRQAWRDAFNRQTHPRARDLIDSVATLRVIPLTWLRQVHEVRACRNALVHEQETEAPGAVPVAEAAQRLVRYFSRLPPGW